MHKIQAATEKKEIEFLDRQGSFVNEESKGTPDICHVEKIENVKARETLSNFREQ